jgi:hypothetical protein
MAKTTTDDDLLSIHKPFASKVKNGHLMALVTYVKVADTRAGGDHLKVSNVDEGVREFEIHGRDIVESSYSADQYEEEKPVSKTKLAEILVNSHNLPFTVVFDKENGEERTLRGRLVHPEPLLGRSKVEDLDLPKTEHRLRLVDHRTIKSLTVNGVKYTLKGQ